MFPGVWSLAGLPDVLDRRLTAAAAWIGHRGAVSHRAAAYLHGFDECSWMNDRAATYRQAVHCKREFGSVCDATACRCH